MEWHTRGAVGVRVGAAVLRVRSRRAGRRSAEVLGGAEFLDRPGIERQHELSCWRTESVALVSGPAHGTLLDVRLVGGLKRRHVALPALRSTRRRRIRVRAAPERALRLGAPYGLDPRDPAGRRTPPRSARLQSEALRTAGTAPAELRFHIYCWDYDGDTMVLNGGGRAGTSTPPLHRPRRQHRWDGGAVVALSDGDLPRRGGHDLLGHGRPRRPLGPRGADGQGGPRRRPAAHLPAQQQWLRLRAGYFSVPAPIGVARRFGVICEDADADEFSARLGKRPAHGTITRFDQSGLGATWAGSERWVDVGYQPADASGTTDPFSVIADTPGRARQRPPWRSCRPTTPAPPAGAADTTARRPRAGGRRSCGELRRQRGRSADRHGHPCPRARPRGAARDHGGPLRGERDRNCLDPGPGLPRRRRHGRDGRRRVRPADGDVVRSLCDRRPEPGSSGLPGWPDYPVPPGVAPGARASRGQAPPVAPADQARLALGTRDVTLVKRLGDARVYARRSAVRHGLAPVAGKAALAVTCPLECRLDSRVDAAAGARTRRAARAWRGRAGGPAVRRGCGSPGGRPRSCAPPGRSASTSRWPCGSAPRAAGRSSCAAAESGGAAGR